jgi:hypothetical protein
MCEETVAGTTPASPEWFVVPRVTDSLTENVTTEVSAIVADTRFRQGSTPTEAEITGDLATELSVGTFDKFISAVAMNEWVVDGVDPNKSTLNFGGSVRKTFTFVKVYSDIGQVFIYRGIYINSMSFQLATTGKVNINFALVGTGFEQTTVNPVSSPTDMSGTPLVSALNVNTFTVDGATTVNTACVQSANVDITNNYEAVRCLGGGKLTAQKYIEKIMDITLATQFAFGTQSAAYIEHIKSRVKMAVAFKIEDSLGNSYEFSFPTLEVSEANHPDAGGEDLVYLDVNFTQVVESPVITRILA